MFIATHRVTLLQEKEGTNKFGDPTDEYKAVKKNIPAKLYKSSTNAYEQGKFDPATGVGASVATYMAILRGVTPSIGDRLKDQADDKVYKVEDVTEYKSITGFKTIEVELERINE